MAYDNTKFYAAFDKWLEHNVTLGFGEHYAGELLADFDEYCRETKMLKRSPGRVAFGRRLGEKGFERRKVRGQTWWSGLELKNPRSVDPAAWAQASTRQKMHDAWIEQQLVQRREAMARSPDERAAELEKRKQELEEEERRALELENAQPVGSSDA